MNQGTSEAAIKLGIKTCREYQQFCHKDPKLPSHPDNFYVDTWEQEEKWLRLLKNGRFSKYATIEEASNATEVLGIKTVKEYQKKYKTDPKLPTCPGQVYSETWVEFGKWFGYLKKI